MEEDKKIKREEKINKEESTSAKVAVDDISDLKKQLEESKAKCEEYLNGWKRERADFINYKKDEMERIGELAKYANEEIILKIIPILDNLCLAANHIKDLPAQAGEGVILIKKQLEDFLKKEGIEPIETLGQKFDPNTMESIGEVLGRPTSQESGMVAEEVQRGYTMHGRIIRVAKVRITK